MVSKKCFLLRTVFTMMTTVVVMKLFLVVVVDDEEWLYESHSGKYFDYNFENQTLFGIKKLNISSQEKGEVGNDSEDNMVLKECHPISNYSVEVFEPRIKNVPNTLEEIETLFPHLDSGGRSKPKHCKSSHRVAIIIPCRDRMEHLQILLLNLHSFLLHQDLDYGIYVVEQFGNGTFNKATLLNIASSEALKFYNYKCFIFHDVDLIPEDSRILYTCPKQPRHMSVAVNTLNYTLPYDFLFGGVVAISVKHFQQVNGYSNMFWGWGGEDDDMSFRIKQKNLTIVHYPESIARYTMLNHTKEKPSPNRYKYLFGGVSRMENDGLNSIKYNWLKIEFKKLYTWILVDLFPEESGSKNVSTEVTSEFKIQLINQTKFRKTRHRNIQHLANSFKTRLVKSRLLQT